MSCCAQIRKEVKKIMGTALACGIIGCAPFIIVDCMLWFGEISIYQAICAIVPVDFQTYEHTVARCIEVDLWSEVALMAFLIIATIISCNVRKESQLMALKISSFVAIIFCIYLIGWYFYSYYVTIKTVGFLQVSGFDCGRLFPYMTSLTFGGLITKVTLMTLLSLRPAPEPAPEEQEQRIPDPNQEISQQVIEVVVQQS